MNLALPRYRNHFHPAWLLLPVPPLVAVAINWFGDNYTEFLAFGIRTVLIGILLAAIVALRFSNVTGTGLRLLKELRQQLPGTMLAILAPGVFAWHEDNDTLPWAVGSFGLGCLLLGANAFGAEFEQRTLGGLLAQPLRRNRIFAEKLGVLVAVVLLATLNLGLTLVPAEGFHFDFGDGVEVALVALLAVCSGPLFSLLSRSTLAGLVFTAVTPAVLFMAITLSLGGIHHLLSPADPMPEAWITNAASIGGPLYLVVTALLGWRTFVRLQSREGGGRSAHALHPLSLPVDRLFRRVMPAGHAWSALIRKELRLHVVPWLVAGILVGLTLLGWLLRWQAEPGSALANGLNDVTTLSVWSGLLGTLSLIVAGAASVAEERELGTLEWQLTQPTTLARQWWLKAAVATGVALMLGVLLPATLIWLSFEAAELTKAFGDMPLVVFTAYATFFSLLFVVALYASSISRSTMKATATTVFIAGGMATCLFLLGLAGGTLMESQLGRHTEKWPAPVDPPAWAPSPELCYSLASAAIALTAAGVAVALLVFAGQNSRRLHVPTASVVRQLTGLMFGLALVLSCELVLASQLVLLRMQADRASWQAELKEQAIQEIRRAQADGRFSAEVAVRFSAAPTDPAEAIVQNLIGREGFDALGTVGSRIRAYNSPAPSTGGTFRMSPELARRYGLMPAPADTNGPSAVTPTNPPAVAPAFQMSPEMQKRYGISPTPPAP